MGVQTATHKVCGRLRVVVQKQKAHQWFFHSTVHKFTSVDMGTNMTPIRTGLDFDNKRAYFRL